MILNIFWVMSLIIPLDACKDYTKQYDKYNL